jgi:general nucleoside transport system ATP-binding protein
MAPLVEMRGIRKRFAGVTANDGIDLEVRQGEIIGLLGENGAGKTTLMNILYGIYQPDAGEIFLHGQKVAIHSPRDAMRLGIGMVHQHFRLVTSHTVAENVVLGWPEKFFHPDRAARGKLEELSRKYGLRVDIDAPVWHLSAGEQQRVEILKALWRGSKMLILDEPTSMLTPGEIDDLLTTVRRMAADGHSVIFITHKLNEITAFTDRVAVLRQGKVMATRAAKDTNEHELARLMIGREVLFRLDKPPAPPGQPVLQVEGLRVLNDKGLEALRNVTLSVAAGEIVGIAGVAGNGQRELVQAIVGLRPVAGGRIRIRGDGVSYVPGEQRTGVVPSMSVAENLVLKRYRHRPFAKGLFLRRDEIANHADSLISSYSIVTPSRDTPIRLLSGGNIQRVILARECTGTPALLVAEHPTSGVDVGATETIRQLLLQQRARGMATLLVSEDLEEVLQLSDRVAVMFNGEIMGVVAASTDVETIGRMMAGIHREGA